MFQRRSPRAWGQSAAAPAPRAAGGPDPRRAARHFLANFSPSCSLRQSCRRRPPGRGGRWGGPGMPGSLRPPGHGRAPLARSHGPQPGRHRPGGAAGKDGGTPVPSPVRGAGPCSLRGVCEPCPALPAGRRAPGAARSCGGSAGPWDEAVAAGRCCPCPEMLGLLGAAASGLSRPRSPRGLGVALPWPEPRPRSAAALRRGASFPAGITDRSCRQQLRCCECCGGEQMGN